MVTRLMDLHCVIPCFFEQLLRKALLDEGNVTVRPLVPAEAQKSEGDFGPESPLLAKLPKCSEAFDELLPDWARLDQQQKMSSTYTQTRREGRVGCGGHPVP